jgi:hypothetical protein
MRVVVAILAALGILILLTNGGESDISGREREGFEEGPAQPLAAAPLAQDPAPVIAIIEEQGRDRLPAETAAQLTEVRDLLTGVAGQPPEQAKPALEEAVGKLDSATAQIETAARETSNEVTELRLLRLKHVLQAVREAIATRVEGL